MARGTAPGVAKPRLQIKCERITQPDIPNERQNSSDNKVWVTSGKAGSEKRVDLQTKQATYTEKDVDKPHPSAASFRLIEVNCGENKSTSNTNRKMYLPYKNTTDAFRI